MQKNDFKISEEEFILCDPPIPKTKVTPSTLASRLFEGLRSPPFAKIISITFSAKRILIKLVFTKVIN